MREDETSDADDGKVITPYGKKIRPYAIDEMPQLISVLRGDMSLVGPRALSSKMLDGMLSTLDRNTFDEWLNAYMLSRPGGLSSYGISIRDPEFTEKTYLMKARMDVDDFNGASLTHDLGIIKRAGAVSLRRLLGSSPMPAVPIALNTVQPEQLS
jgi:lipopolysaccharide/colanic/teichoic acid biosynthesis glycosyltransferase